MSHVFPIPVPPGTLEHDLAGVLAGLGLSARQGAAVSARLGFGGEPATTLAEAAAVCGYTRERVRQLESKVLPEFARQRPPRSVVRALSILVTAVPETLAHVAELVCEGGLAAAPFDPSGILNAAAAFGLPVDVRVRGRLVVHDGSDDVLAALAAAARAQSARRGAANAVEAALELGIDPARARRLLMLVPGVRWLDDRRTWFSVAAPDTTQRVEALLRKMLSVAPALTLEELDGGMRRAFRPVAVPPGVLRHVVRTLPWIEGRTAFAATVPLDPTRELSPAELGVVRVVERAGGEVRFSRAVALGAPKLNRNTIAHYLRHSPVFASVARGTYRLRGRGAVPSTSWSRSSSPSGTPAATRTRASRRFPTRASRSSSS
jgi:hypothetical protein